MLNLKLAIYAFVGLLISGSSYASLNCSAHPSCEAMGYSKTETCENGSLIYCPFDTSYKKCITASAKCDFEKEVKKIHGGCYEENGSTVCNDGICFDDMGDYFIYDDGRSICGLSAPGNNGYSYGEYIPENAYYTYTVYDICGIKYPVISGWECPQGYKKIGDVSEIIDGDFYSASETNTYCAKCGSHYVSYYNYDENMDKQYCYSDCEDYYGSWTCEYYDSCTDSCYNDSGYDCDMDGGVYCDYYDTCLDDCLYYKEECNSYHECNDDCNSIYGPYDSKISTLVQCEGMYSCSELGYSRKDKTAWCGEIAECPYDDDYTLCKGVCEDYKLTSCPSYGNCSTCSLLGGTKKYILDSCRTNYCKYSDDKCAKICSSSTYPYYGIGGKGSTCTGVRSANDCSGEKTYYTSISCPTNYKLSGDHCVGTVALCYPSRDNCYSDCDASYCWEGSGSDSCTIWGSDSEYYRQCIEYCDYDFDYCACSYDESYC
ncbi:MAG: hypothetical protein E7012_06360 [Alphaproteobacteria bacterium]|nr:hypothetical protein [Alphaproteobacteria bacterium]